MGGSQWVVRRIEFLSDNESVVAVLKSGTSKDRNLMVLLCYLTQLAVCVYRFVSPGQGQPGC